MAKALVPTLDTLLKVISSYYPDADLALIRKAYAFAEKAHKGQMRSSGEPYMIHPTAVSHILAEMGLDLPTIATGLLHDVVEDTHATTEEIQKEFGPDVAELVEGVTKLSKITFRTTEEKQAENFRKMLIAMAKDIRVVLVKLADRVHNMRTLQHLPPQKQKSIAQETLDIYAPIANRLGISWMKIELEDHCLRFLHPDAYHRLSNQISMSKKERETYIEEMCETLREKLRDYDIVAQVSGRAKHFYSIFKKMERRSQAFEDVADIIAFRILVENITECYKALGVIHATYKPIPGRFKDYIAMPKANSYQSLHTMVIGPKGERIEVQIRTQDMHQVAESGIAAHWKYKEGKFSGKSRENVDWVNRLLEWQKDLSDPSEFIDTVKTDLFAEDVFVFTPLGEVKQLPYGSTPLDFAYSVHSDVGNHCVSAKVDGRMVPLRHPLKSGETIEVITSPSQSPSKDWLKIVKTSRAKAKIRAYIKTQERDRANEMGKQLLEKALKPFGLTIAKLEKEGKLQKLLQASQLRTEEDLLIRIGYGRILPEELIRSVLSKEELDKIDNAKKHADDESFLKKVFRAATKRSDAKNAITVADQNDILIRFAKCCNPLPGDPITGFITRGRGVTIHTSNCPKALSTDLERKIDVRWNVKSPEAFKRHVRVRVICNDEPGLLALISQTITACGINITQANVRTTKDKKAIFFFDVEVTDVTHLEKMTNALESKKYVLSVERKGS